MLLHLYIPTTTILKVNPRQFSILMEAFFHKHFWGSFYRWLLHFIALACICAYLGSIFGSFLVTIGLNFGWEMMIPSLIHCAGGLRIVSSSVITHIKSLAFNLLVWSDVVTAFKLIIRPCYWRYRHWILLLSLLHQKLLMVNAISIIAWGTIELRGTTAFNHSIMRLGDCFPCRVVQSLNILLQPSLLVFKMSVIISKISLYSRPWLIWKECTTYRRGSTSVRFFSVLKNWLRSTCDTRGNGIFLLCLWDLP